MTPLIPDEPLFSLRRLWFAFWMWVWLILDEEEPTYVPLWFLLVFNRRPYIRECFERWKRKKQMSREPIRFSFMTRMTQAGIQRSHRYKKKEEGGGHSYAPELHVVLDANHGDGYSDVSNRGAVHIYMQDPELVRRVAEAWWERGLQQFDTEDYTRDPGRIKFRVTVEEITEDE